MFSFPRFVIQYHPSLFTTQLVAEMNEVRIHYHLVIGQAKIVGQLSQSKRIIASDICSLSLQVLAGGRASYYLIELRAPIPGVDVQRLVPGIPKRLKDFEDKGLDAVPDTEVCDGIDDAEPLGSVACLKLPITEILTDCSHNYSSFFFPTLVPKGGSLSTHLTLLHL